MIRKLKNKLSHLFHPVQGEMWCLHRVVEQRSEYPSNRELELTPSYLEALILRSRREGFVFPAGLVNLPAEKDQCHF